MFSKLLNYALSFALIMVSLWAGNAIQHFFSLSVPGSIFGMLILFALLASGIVKVRWVKPGAQFIIRYMIILFVPISVGLMDHFPVLLDNALSIFASSIGATTIVLVLLALGLQKILTDKPKHKEKS
ncbi:CidA/LrgA family protein [Vibrio gangliei]|uniref:CidA/LrgA family protein n=1 Tax=Vibrio gangliei TaxID=2077090 RepID=UPI000D016C80|nr:CidA/LrgA family protein [Vibrio gangliei]